MKLRCIVKVWRLAGGRSKIVKEAARGNTWRGSHDRHSWGWGVVTPSFEVSIAQFVGCVGKT